MTQDEPRYGEYAPPGWTPPEPQPAWPSPAAAAPQGPIPLRPLFLADVIAGVFKLIRRNPRPTIWFALGLTAVASVLAVVIVGAVLWNAVSGLQPGTPPALDTVRGVLVAATVGALAAVVVQVVLIAIPQAVVTVEVALATLGERRTVRELWARARGRVPTLIAWMLILGVGGGAAVLLGALGLAELAIGGGVAGAVTAVGVGLLGLVAVLVIAFWLGTKLAFVPALIVIERLPLGAALRRSWALTAGSFWRILGITLLVGLIVQVGAQVLMMPVTFLSSFVEPTATLNARAIAIVVLAVLVQIIVSAVAVVVQAAVPAVLYLDVRMRREGFDAVLRADAEARAAGRTPAADPFE